MRVDRRRVLLALIGGFILFVMLAAYLALVTPRPGENPFGIDPSTVSVSAAISRGRVYFNVSFVAYGGGWDVSGAKVTWNPNLVVLDLQVVNATAVDPSRQIFREVGLSVEPGEGIPGKVIVKVRVILKLF